MKKKNLDITIKSNVTRIPPKPPKQDSRGIKVHELKIYHKYMIKIINRLKTFEIRKNDRDYKEGDILQLKEIEDDIDEYTGYEIFVKIEYIHKGLGMENNYICMAIKEVKIK